MLHRLLGLMVMSIFFCACATADEEKKAEKKEKADGPEAIVQEMVGKLGKAKNDKGEREKVFSEYSGKLLGWAKANAETEKAPETLMLVLRIPGKGGPESPKAQAKEILLKDHMSNAKLGKLLRRNQIGPADGDLEEFVKTVLEKHSDKATRAYAAKALIGLQENLGRFAEAMKENEELKSKLIKDQGENLVKKILADAENAEKNTKKYQALLDGELKGVFPNLSVGAAAPEIESKDLEGKKVKLSDLKGKVVVLDIWATWCGPCKAMIPHTRELVKKMKDKPFSFVSVSADDKLDTVTEFIKKEPMPWTHWYNGADGGIIE
ncbi:MAG: TlpA family protein disulfide reductase, partial [Gemmataceae bacterium]